MKMESNILTISRLCKPADLVHNEKQQTALLTNKTKNRKISLKPFHGLCDFCSHPAAHSTLFRTLSFQHTFYHCGSTLCAEIVEAGLSRFKEFPSIQADGMPHITRAALEPILLGMEAERVA